MVQGSNEPNSEAQTRTSDTKKEPLNLAKTWDEEKKVRRNRQQLMLLLQRARTLGQGLPNANAQEAEEDLDGKDAKKPRGNPGSGKEATRSHQDPALTRTNPK